MNSKGTKLARLSVNINMLEGDQAEKAKPEGCPNFCKEDMWQEAM